MVEGQEKFIRFLKENNVYNNYCRNVKETDNTFNTILFKPKSYWIAGAFVWISTKEGHEFWENISTKWELMLGT